MAGIIGPCGAYRRVQDEGVDLTRRSTLNFTGAGVTATDSGAVTQVDIPGGGGGGGNPKLAARVYHSTDQAVADSTNVTLTFDSELWDTDTMHDPATLPERLTCKTAGMFICYGEVYFDTNATGYRFVGIYQSLLTGFIVVNYAANAGASVGTALAVSTIYPFNVGEYAELRVRQTSGGSLNVRALPNYSAHFGLTRIST
jgi:hypothetical protein